MTYINHLLFHQEMQLGIFGYFCLLLALGYFKLLWDSAFNKLIKILVTVFLCSTAITQQLEWELSLLSALPCVGLSLALVLCQSSVLWSFSKRFWRGRLSNGITNSVLLSAGTINSLRCAWEWPGRSLLGGKARWHQTGHHSWWQVSFHSRKPHSQEGVCWNYLVVFFFLFNWTFILFNLKYLTFPLFQVPVWTRAFAIS